MEAKQEILDELGMESTEKLEAVFVHLPRGFSRTVREAKTNMNSLRFTRKDGKPLTNSQITHIKNLNTRNMEVLEFLIDLSLGNKKRKRDIKTKIEEYDKAS